ncbi:hypothetical protein Hypma_006016 [Hypsizygus marmoreus]|uniref:F-box domain-containing protein n=1 Tax=Hypsizygus marmoreus TaxID=39966 RepID=A0A369K1I3_HYPMA|nr:hypothetical protein Hypma_006016 [Hypsizygus marmoreus]
MGQLVDDILLRILTFCDIYRVLNISKASRRLHVLAFFREVWLALIFDLCFLSFIDLPPGKPLREYTVEALVDLAKRIVQGPRSWKTITFRNGPRVSHQIVLHPPPPQNLICIFREPKLLPGGRFLLLHEENKLECWALQTHSVVWAYHNIPLYPHQPQLLQVLEAIAVEMVDGGNGVVILMGICLWGLEERLDRGNVLKVVHIDLLTGSSTTRFTGRVADSYFESRWGSLRIQGNYAIARLLRTDNTVMCNISTAAIKTFKISEECTQIDIVSGHLIVSTSGSQAPHSVVELSLLSMHAVLTSDGCTPPPLASTVIHLPSSTSTLTFYVSAHRSPLRRDASTIWLFAGSINPAFSLVRKFHVLHSQADSKALSMQCVRSWESDSDERRLRTTVLGINTDASRISYAGYVGQSEVPFLHSLANPDIGFFTIDIPMLHMTRIHLSDYSGALTYATPQSVVVNYYK